MKRNETFELVLTSLFVALIFLMGFVPQIGFITLVPGNPITIIHIPVLLAAVLFRRKYAFIPALAFGVVSLLQALMNQVGFNVAFINPMVSIVPRLLFAVAVHFLYQLLKKVVDNPVGYTLTLIGIGIITVGGIILGVNEIFKALDQVWIIIIALSIILLFAGTYFYLYKKHNYKSLLVPSLFILGTLIHTILVVVFASIFSYDVLVTVFGSTDIAAILVYLVGFNGMMEAVVAALIGTPIFLVLISVPVVQNRLLKD